MLGIDELVVAYGLARAVRGVSLEVEPGRIVGILGRNGAGKTTLLRGVSGLVPVVSGSVRLDGQDVTGRRADSLARAGICHVLEDRGMFGDLTVEDNLNAAFTGVRRSEEARRTASVVALFPWLAERQAQLAGSLSGGQQQMVAIARALLRAPSYLLLDEPSKGLAPAVVASVADALRHAARERGMGILLVEQSFDLLWTLSDTVCVLGEGRIVLSGRKDSLSPDQVRRAYFGDVEAAA